MNKPHISFISAPIAACVNPTLPIATALVRRGYRVTYATSEPFLLRVARTGAEVIEYKHGVLTAKDTDNYLYCRLAAKTISATEPFYHRHPPDLIIYEFVALAGRILAHRWHAPAVQTSCNFAFTTDHMVEQIRDPRLRRTALNMSAEADKFLNAHDLQRSGFIFHRERLNLFLFPREFEPSKDALDQSCLHVGRCAGEQEGFGEWTPPHSPVGPTILVAPSRSYARDGEYFRMCVNALSGMRCHVVLSIDDNADTKALGPLPEGFELVQRTSHAKIMRHADLLIGMAGTATSSEAAYHGLPLVVTSCGAIELECAADNLMRLGVGTHIRGSDISPDCLREAVERTLSSSLISNNVERLKRSIRKQAGAEDAANAIEELLGSSVLAMT